MRHLPQVKSVMTPFPYSIDLEASLDEAREMMDTHNIRHLPVTDHDHTLMGVLTDRDIRQFLGPANAGEQRRVRDVYIGHPYTVDLNEALDNVLMHMAENHIGSALVTRHGKLAGLFTVTDACRHFALFLRERFRPLGGGNEAA